MILGMARDDDAAVVWNVQPFVRVGGPRIGQLDAIRERAELFTRARPEAEGTVDVEPRAMLLRRFRYFAQRVKRSGIHVAGLRADDDRSVQVVEQPAQAIGAHPSLPIRL